MDYNVSSSRILRDNSQKSRGVGFARYAPLYFLTIELPDNRQFREP